MKKYESPVISVIQFNTENAIMSGSTFGKANEAGASLSESDDYFYEF